MKSVWLIATLGACVGLSSCGGEQQAAPTLACNQTTLLRDLSWLFPATLNTHGKLAGLKTGTPVLAAPGQSGQLCVYSVDRQPPISGWVALDGVDPVEAHVDGPQAWIGAWTKGDDRITISPDGENFHVVGQAAGVATPVFDLTTPVTGPTLAFRVEPCGITMDRIGDYLVAVDNKLCAPAGATLAGVYAKAP